jgi:hypothetical protein
MKDFLSWFSRGLIIGLIVVGIIKYPAVKNYLTGNSVIVEYSWVNPNEPNEVEIKAHYDSAIPLDYSLYVYNVEPNRYDSGFSVPNDEEWDFVSSTTGWGAKTYFYVNHTEVVEAVCVPTGTDPNTAFRDDSFTFDTADTGSFAVTIDCK